MEIVRHWRNGQTTKAFVGEKCENGHVSLFPRKVCYECKDEKPIEATFSSKLPLYTSGSYMVVPERELQLQEL